MELKRILSKRVRRRWRREDCCAIIVHPTAFIQQKPESWNLLYSFSLKILKILLSLFFFFFLFFLKILLSPRMESMKGAVRGTSMREKGNRQEMEKKKEARVSRKRQIQRAFSWKWRRNEEEKDELTGEAKIDFYTRLSNETKRNARFSPWERAFYNASSSFSSFPVHRLWLRFFLLLLPLISYLYLYLRTLLFHFKSVLFL